MNEQPRTVRRRTWAVTTATVEQGDVTTRHPAALDTGPMVLESNAVARSTRPTAAPERRGAFARGRAPVDTGHRLLRMPGFDASAGDIAVPPDPLSTRR